MSVGRGVCQRCPNPVCCQAVNWIMLQKAEVDDAGRAVLCGRRALHVLNVLGSRVGHRLRVGVVNGPKGEATVTAVGEERVDLVCVLEQATVRPRLSLVLALPRPKVMRRLWVALGSIGLDRIVLTNAERVERPYFDTHWVREEHYTPLLLKGLEQTGETALPDVSMRKRLKPFVEDELDDLFRGHERLIAQPGEGVRLHAFRPEARGRVAVAIGPEGGWSAFEVQLLTRNGFRPVTIGRRALRTETACVAILAALQGILEEQGP